MQALGALLQLSRCLSAAQHQHGEQRDLRVRECAGLVEERPVLPRPAAGAARQARPAPPREPRERESDRLLVVLDDRIAVRRLVARKAERVQRQRIRIRNGPLLLDEAAEYSELGLRGVHVLTLAGVRKMWSGTMEP